MICVGQQVDPIQFAKLQWPDVTFYREQRQIIYSVVDNYETYVPAANKMGKDFVAGFLAVYFFMTRHPCRVVSTSAKEDHLRVLWGEIGRFIQTARYPLDSVKGGPLIVRHQDICKIVDGEKCPISYMIGLVASADSIAAMQGHHVTPRTLAEANDGIPRTFFLSDESSSVPDEYHDKASTWFKRSLIFGNTWDCQNFWRRHVEAGSVPDPTAGTDADGTPRKYYRRVVHVKAEDSPNVRLGMAQRQQGLEPTNEVIVPGVKEYNEYVRDRETRDPIWQCVSLDANFYAGPELMLFPPQWLNRAEEFARSLYLESVSNGYRRREARGVGVDPGEGSANTSMSAVDESGVIEIVSRQTPNTADVTGEAIAFMLRHGISPSTAERCCFDRGGGGKEHADRLRSQGWPVRTVAFGETLVLEPKRGMRQFKERVDIREDHYAYFNRRAEMYGELSQLLDPSLNPDGFAIPRGQIPNDPYARLRHQLSKFPKRYDQEGRLKLPPKNKPMTVTESRVVCLVDLIGYSPDEADSLVLAVHAMTHKSSRARAGVLT